MEKKFLIFKLYEDLFAVDLNYAREIIPFSAPTEVPAMPSFFEGLIHLRGFFLPLINLKTLLRVGEKKAATKKQNKIIVISVFKKIVGLRADDVEDITTIAESAILPSPSLLTSVDSNFFSGGFYIKQKVILIVDIEKLFREYVIPHKVSPRGKIL